MVDLNLNIQLPPIDFNLLNQAGNTTGQQADMIAASYPELSRDEIMSYVEFYNSLGVPIGKDAIDNLVGGNPIIADPAVVNAVASEVVQSLENPWFAPNPFATFFILFMELQAELTKIKVAEGLLTGEMINMSLDTAKDLAGITKAIYENEAQQAMVSAFVNLAGGIASCACSAMAFKSISAGGQAGFARATAWGSLGGGLGQLATAADKFATYHFQMKRAMLEWNKTIVEAALKVIQDRGISSPAEAQRTADEMISQILQKLDKIIDEAYRAHGFQVH